MSNKTIYTRRQELKCNLNELTLYGSKVLMDGELLYVKQASGIYNVKMGDGVTSAIELPYIIDYESVSAISVQIQGYVTQANAIKNEILELETNTKNYEVSARNYSNSASTSEVNAKSSETNAKTSETLSKQYLDEIKNYEPLNVKKEAEDARDVAIEKAEEASENAAILQTFIDNFVKLSIAPDIAMLDVAYIIVTPDISMI